jgi:hypothetical protein
VACHANYAAVKPAQTAQLFTQDELGLRRLSANRDCVVSGYLLAAVVLLAAFHAGRLRRGPRNLCIDGAAFRRYSGIAVVVAPATLSTWRMRSPTTLI